MALAAPLLAGACSSSGSPAATTPATSASTALTGATVTSRGLRLSGGYVPAPASPDVAAAYLTIENTTDKPIQLVRVVTNVTRMVMAMDEQDSGGVGSMTDLSAVHIPAHGSYRFSPNRAHLMLEKPTALKAGDRVTMTLTFSGAGTVTYVLPVIPLGQAPEPAPSTFGSVAPSGSSMPSMSGMSGMGR